MEKPIIVIVMLGLLRHLFHRLHISLRPQEIHQLFLYLIITLVTRAQSVQGMVN